MDVPLILFTASVALLAVSTAIAVFEPMGRLLVVARVLFALGSGLFLLTIYGV